MKSVRGLIVIVGVLLTGSTQGATSGRRLLQWVVDDDGCRTPNLEVGSCIPVNSCKPMVDFLRGLQSIDDNTRNILRSYTCGYGSNIKVCCPNKAIMIERSSESLGDHPNKKLLPTACGSASSLKITNGKEANLEEFPWQVALRYNSAKTHPFHCGGSLINNRYVLTAAHCIKQGSLKLIAVRFGEHNFNTNPDCVRVRRGTVCAPPSVDIDVTERDAVVHENYVAGNPQNDIALIRLPREIQFTEAILPICLPSTPDMVPKRSTRLTVAGWGTTKTGLTSSSLLKVVVPYVETSDCRTLFRRSGVLVSDGQLCAGGKDGKDSCGGDSGGPIIYQEFIDSELRSVQAGIVSYGARLCGTDGIPSIYTRISSYMDWILNNIKE